MPTRMFCRGCEKWINFDFVNDGFCVECQLKQKSNGTKSQILNITKEKLQKLSFLLTAINISDKEVKLGDLGIKLVAEKKFHKSKKHSVWEIKNCNINLRQKTQKEVKGYCLQKAYEFRNKSNQKYITKGVGEWIKNDVEEEFVFHVVLYRIEGLND